MRRGGDELIGSSISPPPEFQDCGNINPNTSTGSNIVVIVQEEVQNSSSSSSVRIRNPNLLSTVPPPKDFRDLTPSIEEKFIYTFIDERDLLWSFADKISFNILNEAMIIAAVVPDAGRSDAQRRLSISSAASGSGQRDSHCSGSFDTSANTTSSVTSTTSWEYVTAELKNSGITAVTEKNQTNSSLEFDVLKNCGQTEPAMTDLGRILASKAPSKITTTTYNLTSSNIKELSSSPSHDVTSDVELTACSSTQAPINCQCDIIYSLPVDNIPNGTINSTSPASLPLTFSCMSTSLTVTDNTSSPQRIQASNKNCKMARYKLANGVNVPGPSDNPDGNEINDMSEIMKQRHSTDTPVLTRLNRSGGESDNILFLESNNNFDSRTEEKVVNQRCSSKKKVKKKRRRNLLSNEADFQQAENEVPGKLKGINSQRQCTDGLKAVGSCKDGKPKRTIGDTFFGLFRKSRAGTSNKGKVTQASSIIPSLNAPQTTEVLHMLRALPPTPCKVGEDEDCIKQLHFHCEELSETSQASPLEPRDIAASIEKVKDCGWYWGPLSSEAAEDLLRGEPDGSFIVRDSSDSHYIFSLTFKLNGLVRHVRIEHDHGNFSFGPMTRFKASTIVDFVEKAIAHSRSGRYLFFLHRRPVLGPMRVQLIHPYSRFRHMRSLQHMCRFAILKQVRRDLINSLPLPNPLLQYLNTPHYYFEKQQQ